MKFESLEYLKSNYKVVIPTTMFNETAPYAIVEKVKEEVKKAMAKEFGGFTEFTAIGGYLSQAGEIIEEMVYVIESYFKKENDELIFDLAKKIKEDMNQESVMIGKNGKTYFI